MTPDDTKQTQSLITQLDFDSHKITLKKVLDFLQQNQITIYSQYQYWCDSDYAVVLKGDHYFGNQIARDLIFDFDGTDANSKLMKIKCEYQNALGLWVKGLIYKRPWYRGGEWL